MQKKRWDEKIGARSELSTASESFRSPAKHLEVCLFACGLVSIPLRQQLKNCLLSCDDAQRSQRFCRPCDRLGLFRRCTGDGGFFWGRGRGVSERLREVDWETITLSANEGRSKPLTCVVKEDATAQSKELKKNT